MRSLAPIALFVYARPDHTRYAVDSLKENYLADESDLIIYSDAAKNASLISQVQQVRDYVKTISGFKSVTIIEREQNLGLASSIIDGVAQIVHSYGTVIVIEDDLVTSKYFLQYMNDALDLYKDDPEVISIHGYVYPVGKSLPETFFICGADCWGWATWKKGWDCFESDSRKLLYDLKQQRRELAFNWEGHYGNITMLERQISGTVDSWAIRWHASAFLKNKLTLYPGVSLINNIGGDAYGTHTKSLHEFQSIISDRPIHVDRLPLQENADARQAFVEFFRNIKQSVFQKVLRKIISLIS